MSHVSQNLRLQVDDDGTGRITLNEFERHFKDEAMAELFEALGLGSTDAWSLFQEGTSETYQS